MCVLAVGSAYHANFDLAAAGNTTERSSTTDNGDEENKLNLLHTFEQM